MVLPLLYRVRQASVTESVMLPPGEEGKRMSAQNRHELTVYTITAIGLTIYALMALFVVL